MDPEDGDASPISDNRRGDKDPGADAAPPQDTETESGTDTSTDTAPPAHTPPNPWQGQVRHVSGRGSDDSRGLPPLHSISLSGSDGSDRTFGLLPTGEEALVRVHVLGVAELQNFGMCPICGDTEDLTREHVPQRDLGGTVMTYTCQPCNNRLGAGVEEELRHWYDDAIYDVRFSGGDVPGARKFPRMLLRTTDDQVGMFLDVGKTDPKSVRDSRERRRQDQLPHPAPKDLADRSP